MKNILIVDDSKFIRSVVKDEISKVVKANIFLAESFKEAEQFIAQNHFDIAVLDVHLPDAGKGEVIDLALEHDIPVIVLSSGINETIKNIVMKKDIVEYISKGDPASIIYIATAVNRILKNAQEHVLIVEDSKSQRLSLKHSLEKLQFKVTEASSAEEAIAIIKINKISLVFIDYMLGGMDGMELTMLLRQTYSKDHLAIIAVSAYTEGGVATNFLRFGANDFMAKPYSFEELSTKVNANLELIDLFAENKKKVKELKDSYDLFNAGNVMVFKWQNTDNWPVKYVSKSVKNILGYDIEDFYSCKLIYEQIIHKDDLSTVASEVEENSKNQVTSFTHKDYRLKHKDGTYIWIRDHTHIVYNEKNEITHYIGYVADITEQKIKDKQLDEYIERFNLAIESSRDGIWDWDIKGDALFCSDTLIEMMGFVKDEITCSFKNLTDLVHPDDLKNTVHLLNEHLKRKSEHYESEYRVITKSGKTKWILNRAKVIFDAENNPVRMIGFLSDIDHRKNMELKLAHISSTDKLTGLLNRHGFVERFKAVQKTAERFDRKMALLFIDLDGFKKVNDTLGHAAGDEVLIYVANKLRSTVREQELSVRLGGDEFVVFLPEYKDEDELIQLAQRLVNMFKNPISISQGEVFVGLSIGIATADYKMTLDTLLFNADKAMYKVKDHGKNGYYLSL